jgi:hypothetical protein
MPSSIYVSTLFDAQTQRLVAKCKSRRMIPARGLCFALGAALLFVPLQLPIGATDIAELARPGGFAGSHRCKIILRTSCYACHSNETRLSWSDEIVPAYQLVVHDVKTGRRRLNFSGLGAEPVAIQNALLLESVNQIQVGAMPLRPSSSLRITSKRYANKPSLRSA